jgi:hypothetical protein
VSDVDSEVSEEEPLAKMFKSNSIIEDSEEEWEEWEGIQDQREWPEESGKVQETEEVREVTEEVQEGNEGAWTSSVSETEGQEKAEEEKEMEQREVKRARKEARRSERSEEMKDLIHAVIDLGEKVDRFADEVRVSNMLRNRADREYLEERRRWYFSDRLLHAKDWEKGSEVDSEGHSV